jgi:tetratricopeptide (TPR) repeat protein
MMNEHVALPSSAEAVASTDRAALPSSPASSFGKVFVSYSRRDAAFAQDLVEHLTASGFDAFLDKTDIAPGEPWQERLAALIAAADTVVFVVSPDSAASEICAWELEESAKLGKRLLPIVARRIADAEAPKALGRLNWIFRTTDAEREAALASLDQALHTDLDWVREHTRLAELARRWEERARAKGATLRGADIEAAERWLDHHPADSNTPTELHREFIRASRKASVLRQRIWVGGSLIAAIVAIALAGFAELSRREAQHQRRQADMQRASAETARNEAQAQRDRAEAALVEARTQRDRAERTLTLATKTANTLVFDLALKFRDVVGVRVGTVKAILDRASELQEQLIGAGETDPALLRSQNAALAEIVDTLLPLGDTQAALAAAEKGRGIMLALVSSAPGNALWQRDLALTHDKVGDVLKAQGKLADALAAYRAGLAVRESLVKDDPANYVVRRGLATSHSRIGTVQKVEDKLADALASFSAALAIEAALFKADPGNLELRRDLSIIYDRMGDIQLALEHAPEAQQSFEASLGIRESLVTSDPANATWQHGLSVAYTKIGDALAAQDKSDEALRSFASGLEIRERLAKSDPGNASWQQDLSFSYDRIAGILLDEGKTAEAVKSLEASLSIRDKLATSDSGNPQAQRELAAAYAHLGIAYRKAGAVTQARSALVAGRAIVARLVAEHPQRPSWKTDLDWLEKEIAALGG